MTSPPPTSRSRPRWRRVAIALGCLCLGAGGAVATYPRWADGWVQSYAAERLQKIAGVPATIDRLDVVDYDSIVLEGVTLTIDAETSLKIDRVEVELDREALWSGRAVVVGVRSQGGAVTGEAGALRRYFAELRDRLSAGTGDGSGRVKLVPEAARAEGLRVDLRAQVGERELHGTAAVSVDVDVARRHAAIELTALELGIGERVLRAAKLATELDAPKGLPGVVQFPLTLKIEGAATAVTPQIAAADIHGSVTVADLAVSRVALDLVGGFSDEARNDGDEVASPLWAIRGDVARDLADGKVELTMESFKLGRVPEVLARLPVVESEAATVGGDLKVAFADGVAHVDGDLELAGLNVDHPLLARQPVRGLGFSLEVSADLDPARRSVTIESASLRRGAVTLELDGEFVHAEAREDRRYRAHLKMPKVRCQDFLAAIPAELTPSLQGFELKGDFEFEISSEIAFNDLDALTLTAKLNPDTCKPVKVPQLVSATRLTGALVHRVVMRDGSEREVDVREGSESFTALDQISPYMLAAVMTTEDGGFWKHKGFITSQFRAALRRNLEAGKIRLGASTITMQMVKNVLLSHERTLSRKLQEVFLTWYVEQTLTKQRIMELYLNVIEFGPGVYGVTRAASHYFGKLPADLTPPEAAYLALMLPSPVRRHVNYCEGALTPVFQAKLKRLLSIMHSRGRLDPEIYEQWKDSGVTFDATELAGKRECLAEIERLLSASAQQRSLSGLLDDAAEFEDLPIEAEPVVAAGAGKPKKGRGRAGMDAATLEMLSESEAPDRRQP